MRRTIQTNWLSLSTAAAMAVTLLGPSLASAEHTASCAVPDHVMHSGHATDSALHDGRLRERRLRQRARAVRRDVRRATHRIEGLEDWWAEEEVREARRRVRSAAIHIDNGAFWAAGRSLDRAEALARSLTRRARRLGAFASDVRGEINVVEGRMAHTRTLVRRADCTIAAAHLRAAGGQLRAARRDARRGQWRGSRRSIRLASAKLDDAGRQARASIQKKEQRLFGAFKLRLDDVSSDVRDVRSRLATRELAGARAAFRSAKAEAKRGDWSDAKRLMRGAERQLRKADRLAARATRAHRRHARRNARHRHGHGA